MKKFAILAVAIFSIASCNKKAETTDQTETSVIEQTESTTATDDETTYACPMHPEVTGKKGDKCPKCEMDLVMHDGHEHTDGTHDHEHE